MQQGKEKNLHLTRVVGKIIREIRIQKTGLSCAKIADEFDLDRGNLNRIENGLIDSKFTTIWKVSEALGLKFSEFAKLLEQELGEDFTLIDE